MNNTYKISSIVLIIVLSFFAVQASLQEVDTSGDTGTTMDIVEPQDGVSLDDDQVSPESVESSDLPVGEAGELSLKLGEPETPVLVENGLLEEMRNEDKEGLLSEESAANGQAGNNDENKKNNNQGQNNNEEEGGQIPVDQNLMVSEKEYWLYIRTYDKPEINFGETGGRSKKGDIVQILDVSRYPNPSEIERKEWLIIKVSGLTQNQIETMTQPWAENKQTYEIEDEDNKTQEIKAYRKYNVDLDEFKNQEGINISEGLWEEKADKSDIINQIETKNNKDISRYYWQSVRYALTRGVKETVLSVANLVIHKARATTTNTFTVIPAGGGNYASLSLWEDARDGDITAATGTDSIEIANASGSTADTTALAIAGWTTAAANYIQINGDNTAGKWNTSAYILQTTGFNVNSITVSGANHVRINKLQIDHQGTGSSGNCISVNYTGAGDAQISNVICQGAVSSGINIADQTEIWNTISYNNGSHGFRLNSTAIKIYNCTAVDNTEGGVSWWAGPSAIVNCLATHNTGNDFNKETANNPTTITNNASEDVTADDYGGSANNASIVTTNLYNNYTSDDFHLQSGSPNTVVDAGTNSVGGYFTDDIDGVTRSGTWDIGADEYVPTASTYQPRPPISGTGTGPAMY